MRIARLMAFSGISEAKRLSEQLGVRQNAPGNAAAQSYVGSPYPVLGLSVPSLRGILAAYRKERRNLTAKEVNAVAYELWRGKVYEEKALAIILLDRYAKVLDDASWRLLDRFIDAAVGWGLCDALRAGPIAKLVRARPERFRELLRWAKSDNFWRRRVAVYGLHDLVFAKALDKPFALLEKILFDGEFWVQRAVGTWLRECWKRDRRRTEALLRRHARGLPKVVITVATERAPKSFREELRNRNRATKV